MADQPLAQHSVQQQSLKELNNFVIRELVRGRSQDALVQHLTSRGWPQASARQFVANAARLSNEYREVNRERRWVINHCKSRMLRGLLWTVAAIGITIISHDMGHVSVFASIVFFLSILFGFLDFLYGLAGWWRTRR
jgi:hypothetical protein